MRLRAQLMMVMALDKCLGCHTCSVTCKQAWTNRDGTDYIWFNNVETKPGVGYPRRWEDQEAWNGGWSLDRAGRLRLRAGGRLKKLITIFGNFDLPTIDDYYEPWTYDYSSLITAPHSERTPVARAHSRLTGKPMALALGAQLGGRSGRRRWLRRPRRRRPRRAATPALRAGLHVLSAAHLQPLPQPLVRGLMPLGRHVQARGGRHRSGRPGPVPRLALLCLGLPLQEGLLQPHHRQGREVHLLLCDRRGRPADDLLGDLRRAPAFHRRRPLRPRRGHGRGRDPARGGSRGGAAVAVARPARRPHRRRGRAGGRSPRLDRGRPALARLRAGQGAQGGVAAAPRVPHAAHGLVCAAALAGAGYAHRRRLPDRRPRARSSAPSPTCVSPWPMWRTSSPLAMPNTFGRACRRLR